MYDDTMRLAFASARLLPPVKLQIALAVFMALLGCSKLPSLEGLQGNHALEESTRLQKGVEDAAAGYLNEDWALDALAIPYIKDQRIKERIAQMHWCGTPALEYLASNARPSENMLITRAATIEVAWRDTVYNQ